MFTGITEQVGRIESLRADQEGGVLRVHIPAATDLSVSVAREMKHRAGAWRPNLLLPGLSC